MANSTRFTTMASFARPCLRSAQRERVSQKKKMPLTRQATKGKSDHMALVRAKRRKIVRKKFRPKKLPQWKERESKMTRASRIKEAKTARSNPFPSSRASDTVWI